VLSKCCAFSGTNCVGSPQGASPPCLPALFPESFREIDANLSKAGLDIAAAEYKHLNITLPNYKVG
jgi:hypothetical protein